MVPLKIGHPAPTPDLDPEQVLKPLSGGYLPLSASRTVMPIFSMV